MKNSKSFPERRATSIFSNFNLFKGNPANGKMYRGFRNCKNKKLDSKLGLERFKIKQVYRSGRKLQKVKKKRKRAR